MSAANLDTTLARFEATIQRTKNRLVAVPAPVQRSLGLAKRPDNHIVRVSIRRAGTGYWNHHYLKLTADNEFSIPSDVTGLQPGDAVEVKVHAVVADVPVWPPTPAATAAGSLLRLANRERPRWRTDGSVRLDEYLQADARG